MYKLYYAPGTCALAPHIALEEAGADYEAVRVDFKANQQQSPDYLELNPKGRVPALVTDRGILTENPAILAYIAQTLVMKVQRKFSIAGNVQQPSLATKLSCL